MKDIQLFSPDQMKLNLVKHAESLPIPEEVKLFFKYADSIVNEVMEIKEGLGGLDGLVQPVLANVGKFAAEQMLKIMAGQLQPILENNNLYYDVNTLMTQEIEIQQNFVGKLVNFFWNNDEQSSENDIEEI